MQRLLYLPKVMQRSAACGNAAALSASSTACSHSSCRLLNQSYSARCRSFCLHQARAPHALPANPATAAPGARGCASLPRRTSESEYGSQQSGAPVRLSDLRKRKEAAEGGSDLRNSNMHQESSSFEEPEEATDFVSARQTRYSSLQERKFQQDKRKARVEEGSAGAPTTPKKDPERLYERAKASAAGSLLRRPHSRKELEDKLLMKEHDPEAVGRALDRLADLELQSDAEFAEVFARSKWRQSKWAPSRIRMELARRGINEEDRAAALTSVFGSTEKGIKVSDPDEDCEEDDDAAGSDGADQQLIVTVQRRLDTMQGLPKEVQKRRLIGWLQRRGHSWNVVSAVMSAVGLL